MKTLKKHPIAVVAVLIVVAYGLYVYFKNSNSNTLLLDANLPDDNSTSPSTTESTVFSRGMRGAGVIAVQEGLNVVLKARNLTQLTVDGIFGQKTENAMLEVLGKRSGSINEINAAKSVYAFVVSSLT